MTYRLAPARPRISQSLLGRSGFLQVSEKGRAFIKRWEELRLISYRDAVGVWTIGYGHTRGVGPGQSITAAVADEMLALDLLPVERFLNQTLPNLDQCEFDAIASLLFNVGITAFIGSGTQRFLSSGDFKAAAARLPKWNKARKDGVLVEVAGLTHRRLEEQRMFLVGDYGKTWS